MVNNNQFNFVIRKQKTWDYCCYNSSSNRTTGSRVGRSRSVLRAAPATGTPSSWWQDWMRFCEKDGSERAWCFAVRSCSERIRHLPLSSRGDRWSRSAPDTVCTVCRRASSAGWTDSSSAGRSEISRTPRTWAPPGDLQEYGIVVLWLSQPARTASRLCIAQETGELDST